MVIKVMNRILKGIIFSRFLHQAPLTFLWAHFSPFDSYKLLQIAHYGLFISKVVRFEPGRSKWYSRLFGSSIPNSRTNVIVRGTFLLRFQNTEWTNDFNFISKLPFHEFALLYLRSDSTTVSLADANLSGPRDAFE